MTRPPFQTVGIMPFTLGAVLALKTTGTIDLPVFCLSLAAICLIMLTTYASGEYYDLEGDVLSAGLERNQFSGGTQAIVRGMLPPRVALVTSYLAAGAAIVIGLVLQFGYHTGPWTIPLGAIGLFFGFFYSTRPIRIVERGFGEVVIGFCYGWLPVATAYYLQTSRCDPMVHWMSIPIAITIFNVILINEFPDYPADIATAKRNLVVRFGKKPMSLLFALAQMGAVLCFPLPMLAGAPPIIWAFFPFVALIGLYPARGMATEGYKDRTKLERMCAATIATNLIIPAFYIAGLVLKG